MAITSSNESGGNCHIFGLWLSQWRLAILDYQSAKVLVLSVLESMHAVRNQEAFWAYLQQFFDLRTKNDQALDESDVAMSSQDRLRLRAKDPSVLDTIMAGTQWFGSPQAGDAIVVIAANMEGGRKTNAKTVAKALGDNHTACLDWPWGRCRAEAA